MGIELLYSVVMLAISVGYQLTQAAKKQDKAKVDNQDYRKGFETVVEGRPDYLPIAYGRALVGGVRVYHNTANSYKYIAPDTSLELDGTTTYKTFQTGNKSAAGGSYTVSTYNSAGGIDKISKTIAAITYTTLSADVTGKKNEFLFFQQALCQGAINDIKDIIIDDSRYINDSSFGMQTKGAFDNYDISNAGMRVDINKVGGKANSLFTANFKEREDATFKDIAYASVVVRLDRDDPQFNGVPNIQFLVEGKKIYSIVRTGTVGAYTYSLSPTKTYSNNPSLCLLDYLTDKVSGKGIELTSVDLASFYNAWNTCNQLLQITPAISAIGHPAFGTNGNNKVATGGKFYFPSGSSVVYGSRDLPLYECNLLVDTKRPIRDNIEDILSTMGDARLVWSAGQYKLNLVYPANTTDLAAASVTTITDDDLVLDQNIEIKYPSASDKLNYCTIKFHNEHENFKEDSISWPAKISAVYKVGGGGFKYSLGSSGFDDTKESGLFLNNYGVWDGATNSAVLRYKFLTPASAGTAYVLKLSSFVSGTINIRAEDAVGSPTVLWTLAHNGGAIVSSSNITLAANTVYTIEILAVSSGALLKSVAASITKSSAIIWTTRSDAYTFFETISDVASAAIYAGYLAADQNIQLETEITVPGITDPYHAIAKAEELVRTSRLTYGITFDYILRNKYPEPGDVITFYSSHIALASVGSPVYFKIESIKLVEDTVCRITATKFTVDMLAWTTKANRHAVTPDEFNTIVPPIAENSLVFTFTNTALSGTTGVLTWPAVSYIDLNDYIVYIHTSAEDYTADNAPRFRELGYVTGNAGQTTLSYNVQGLDAAGAIFGVRVRSRSLQTSRMITTDASAAFLLDTAAFTLTDIVFAVDVNRLITWKNKDNPVATIAGYFTPRNGTPVAINSGSATQTSTVGVYEINYVYFNSSTSAFFATKNLVDTITTGYFIVATIAANGTLLGTTTAIASPLNVFVNSQQAIIGTPRTYSSRDVIIRWSDNAANLNKQSSIKDYVVTVADLNGVVKFVYPVDKNSKELSFPYEENVRLFNVATRSYKFKISSRTTGGILSTADYYTVNNPNIGTAVLTITEGLLTTYISLANNVVYPNATDVDAAGMALFRKPSSDSGAAITPVTVTLSSFTADIVLSGAHGWITGRQVQYTTTGTAITGLIHGKFYFVIVTDTTHFKLSASYSLAMAGTALALTAATGTGTHTFNRDKPVYLGAINSNIELTVDTAIPYTYAMAIYDTFSSTDYLTTGLNVTNPSTTGSSKVSVYEYTGLNFKTSGSTQTVPTNIVAWDAFKVYKDGLVEAYIAAGQMATAWTSGEVFIYYDNPNLTQGTLAAPVSGLILTVVDNLLFAVSNNRRILAKYRGGFDIIADGGKVFIDKDQLIAGSIGATAIAAGSINADKLVTDTAVINTSIQIANGTINTANIAGSIQSTNYTETGKTGWRIGTGQTINADKTITTNADNGIVSYGALEIRSTESATVDTGAKIYGLNALSFTHLGIGTAPTVAFSIASGSTVANTQAQITKVSTSGLNAHTFTSFSVVSENIATETVLCTFSFPVAAKAASAGLFFGTAAPTTSAYVIHYGVEIGTDGRIYPVRGLIKDKTVALKIKAVVITVLPTDVFSVAVGGGKVKVYMNRAAAAGVTEIKNKAIGADFDITAKTSNTLRFHAVLNTIGSSVSNIKLKAKQAVMVASNGGITLKDSLLQVKDVNGVVRVKLGKLS